MILYFNNDKRIECQRVFDMCVEIKLQDQVIDESLEEQLMEAYTLLMNSATCPYDGFIFLLLVVASPLV